MSSRYLLFTQVFARDTQIDTDLIWGKKVPKHSIRVCAVYTPKCFVCRFPLYISAPPQSCLLNRIVNFHPAQRGHHGARIRYGVVYAFLAEFW